ncbi:hypothetical protein IWX91DRAFT_117836 [Phyllosticta citricarpa]
MLRGTNVFCLLGCHYRIAFCACACLLYPMYVAQRDRRPTHNTISISISTTTTTTWLAAKSPPLPLFSNMPVLLLLLLLLQPRRTWFRGHDITMISVNASASISRLSVRPNSSVAPWSRAVIRPLRSHKCDRPDSVIAPPGLPTS